MESWGGLWVWWSPNLVQQGTTAKPCQTRSKIQPQFSKALGVRMLGVSAGFHIPPSSQSPFCRSEMLFTLCCPSSSFPALPGAASHQNKARIVKSPKQEHAVFQEFSIDLIYKITIKVTTWFYLDHILLTNNLTSSPHKQAEQSS